MKVVAAEVNIPDGDCAQLRLLKHDYAMLPYYTFHYISIPVTPSVTVAIPRPTPTRVLLERSLRLEAEPGLTQDTQLINPCHGCQVEHMASMVHAEKQEAIFSLVLGCGLQRSYVHDFWCLMVVRCLGDAWFYLVEWNKDTKDTSVIQHWNLYEST